METLIIQGKSASKAKLLMKLAKEFDFSAKKLNSEEIEDIGLAISIEEGVDSGLLSESEKKDFLDKLAKE
ncbi:MAG: hypothetical protein ACOCWK_01730 [Tangfeifania sp.]